MEITVVVTVCSRMWRVTNVSKWNILHLCKTKPNKSARGHTKNTKWVAALEQDYPPDNQEEPLLVVRNWSFPCKIELHVNGQPLTMEVETGAGVSIPSESVLNSSAKLQRLVLYSRLALEIRSHHYTSVDLRDTLARFQSNPDFLQDIFQGVASTLQVICFIHLCSVWAYPTYWNEVTQIRMRSRRLEWSHSH